MFVDGLAFALASAIVGVPELAEEEIFKASMTKSAELLVGAADIGVVFVRVKKTVGAIRILVEHQRLVAWRALL